MKKTFTFTMLFLSITLLGGVTACSDDDDKENTPVIIEPSDSTDTSKPDTIVTPDPEPVQAAQGWPAEYGGVMLQGFYWDSYDDSQWAVLEQQTDQLAGTFDLVWLPQSGNCGGTSMGYDDLYWFSNYNSSFGTEAQLRSLIQTFQQNGIKTIADVVINHRRNVSNWVDFPKETYKGVTYEMLSTDIVANDDGGATKQWATQNGYELSKNNDSGEGWDGMRDLDHKSENVQTIVKAYLDFLKNDLGYAGFRYDMVKGYSASFTALYNASAQPEFSVGECWDGTNTIKNWIDGTKAGDQLQSAAFDFQFRYTVRNAMNASNYARLGQQNDGNWPLVSSNVESGKYRRYAVTFVENHDTERRSNAAQDPLTRDTLAANAYMMAMPGTPCVFMKHWQAYPAQIKAMVAARKLAGITNQSTYETVRSTAACFISIAKSNDQNRLLVAIGNTAGNEQFIDARQWAKATEGHHYAYYLPTALNTAYADLPSGTYEGIPTVMLSAITEGDAQLVYTTDGSTPTASSTTVPGGYKLSLPVGSTTLKVGLLAAGQVSGVVSRTYTVKEKESEKPVEIPSFCTVSEGETCAFFEAPSTWAETIMCWAWIDNGANFTGGTWPGTACRLLGEAPNGSKVWKWVYDGTLTTRPAKIIFSNNGAPQTDDLLFENGGYYTKNGLKGTVSNTN
ncbi:MAG: starch-binding protein [Prevotella sp.]|nr:starch-binding protein [Prevotella sp.]